MLSRIGGEWFKITEKKTYRCSQEGCQHKGEEKKGGILIGISGVEGGHREPFYFTTAA